MKLFKMIYLQYLKYFNAVKYARKIGVSVGDNCRLLRCDFSTEPFLIKIGNHVSATKVRFETHDGAVWCFREKYPDIDVVKPIVVADNVYIGYGAIILPGVSIGENSIIGAGSVVSKNVPPNCVFAGVPAKFIKSLDEYVEKALNSGDMTKNMTYQQKKMYFEIKYNVSEK